MTPRRILDDGHLSRVRALMCCAPPGHGCDEPAQAHHPRGMTGLGLKANDTDAIPLCRQHHQDLHELRGPFLGWSRERRKAWEAERTESTRRALLVVEMCAPEETSDGHGEF
jgi:hypothetical protein